MEEKIDSNSRRPLNPFAEIDEVPKPDGRHHH
jgi:hypothetical protein